jgi:uncharacterized protein YbjT (DUF2867 family)
VAGADREDSGGVGLNGQSGAAVRVLLIGGSGLVGREMIAPLCARQGFHVDLLLRRSPPRVPAAAEVFVGEPLPQALAAWHARSPRCDVFMSALGTTRRAAGSTEAFARIDHHLVIEIARAAHSAGARQAILVSSIGAESRSRNDYLRIKGELEQGVAAIGFERCDFLHPGLLLGTRDAPSARTAERLGQSLAPLLNPLLRGPLQKYRAIAAHSVAMAAARLVGEKEAGLHWHRYSALRALALGEAGNG